MDVASNRLMELVGSVYAPVPVQNATMLIGLNGAVPNGSGGISVVDNVPDLYNDTLVLASLKNGGWSYKLYRVTTEPGRFYTEVRPNPDGAAHLILSRLYFYRQGSHYGRWALVNVGNDVVWRDKNKNYKFDAEETVYVGPFGIHIHSGGTSLKSVNRYSAGCIAMYVGGESVGLWVEFKELIQSSPFSQYPLVVFDAKDLEWLVTDPLRYKATVQLGSQGVYVRELQQLLNKMVASSNRLTVDGAFGNRTKEVLRQVLIQHELPVVGVVDRKMWQVLSKL